MNGPAFKGAWRDLVRMWKCLTKGMQSNRYFEFSMSKKKHVRNCLVAMTLNKDLSDESPL